MAVSSLDEVQKRTCPSSFIYSFIPHRTCCLINSLYKVIHHDKVFRFDGSKNISESFFIVQINPTFIPSYIHLFAQFICLTYSYLVYTFTSPAKDAMKESFISLRIGCLPFTVVTATWVTISIQFLLPTYCANVIYQSIILMRHWHSGSIDWHSVITWIFSWLPKGKEITDKRNHRTRILWSYIFMLVNT